MPEFRIQGPAVGPEGAGPSLRPIIKDSLTQSRVQGMVSVLLLRPERESTMMVLPRRVAAAVSWVTRVMVMAAMINGNGGHYGMTLCVGGCACRVDAAREPQRGSQGVDPARA